MNESIILINHAHTEPAFNLACEEYFFKQRNENFMLLWRNAPSIIIGRNQNAYAEIDMDYIKETNISVIRRLTGGGAVYHDLGNLNFTFIRNGCDGMADFKSFLKPVTDFLRSLGLDADFSGRNDILVNGLKVSGNAQTSSHGRVMLHGTLLFSVALDVLSQALKPHPLKLQAKGIRSVKSRVTNISEHLCNPMTIDEFINAMQSFFIANGACMPAELSVQDESAINDLVKSKYGTWEWNIGNAPDYSMEKTALLTGGLLTAAFNVSSGKITDIKFSGDFFGEKDIAELENGIKKTPHEQGSLRTALTGLKVEKYIAGATADELAEMFF